MISISALGQESLQKVIDLSIAVFQPTEAERKKYHDPQTWSKHLASDAVMLGAESDGELVGFIFVRRYGQDQMHVWMAGVLSAMRGQGVMTKLRNELETIAVVEQRDTITINTYEKKFPSMFRLFKHLDFTLDHQADEVVNGESLTKSFFKKTLAI